MIAGELQCGYIRHFFERPRIDEFHLHVLQVNCLQAGEARNHATAHALHYVALQTKNAAGSVKSDRTGSDGGEVDPKLRLGALIRAEAGESKKLGVVMVQEPCRAAVGTWVVSVVTRSSHSHRRLVSYRHVTRVGWCALLMLQPPVAIRQIY